MTYYDNENVLYIYLDKNDSKEDLWKKFKIIYDDLTPIPIMLMSDYVVLGSVCDNNRNRISFSKINQKRVIETDKLPAFINSLLKLQEKVDNN